MFIAAEATTEAAQIWFTIYVFIIVVCCCELFVGVTIAGYAEVDSISSPRMFAVFAPALEECNIERRGTLVIQLLKMARKMHPCNKLLSVIADNIQVNNQSAEAPIVPARVLIDSAPRDLESTEYTPPTPIALTSFPVHMSIANQLGWWNSVSGVNLDAWRRYRTAVQAAAMAAVQATAAALPQVLMRTANGQLGAALNQWRCQAAQLSAMQQTIRQTLLRMTNMQLAQSFAQWRSQVASLKASGQVTRQTQIQMVNMGMMRFESISLWREQTVDWMAMEQGLELAGSFLHWKELAVHMSLLTIAEGIVAADKAAAETAAAEEATAAKAAEEAATRELETDATRKAEEAVASRAASDQPPQLRGPSYLAIVAPKEKAKAWKKATARWK